MAKPVVDQAIDLLEARRGLGMRRYSKPLSVEGDGRDFGVEADEEMADWLIYWTGYRIQHQRRVQELLELIGKQAEEIKRLRDAHP